MKKTIKAISFLVLLTTLLCSCFPSGDLDNNSNDYESVTEKAEGIENFSLNIDLPKESHTELPTLYAELKEWEPLVLHNAFFNNEDIITEQLEYNGNCFPEEKRYVDITPNNMLGYEHGCIRNTIYFDGIKDKEVSRKFVCSFATENSYKFSDYNLDLTSFSVDEALLRADELLSRLGITNVGAPTVFTITKEYAAYAADISINELDWQIEDEVYYIVYPISYNDVNLCQYDINILGEEYYSQTGSYISIIMSCDKIIDFNCSLYSDVFDISETTDEIISAEDAANILVNYYSKIDNLDKKEFNSVTLVYVPTGLNNIGFIYEPAWLFEGVKTVTINDEEFESKTMELIYAKTGIRYAYYG